MDKLKWKILIGEVRSMSKQKDKGKRKNNSKNVSKK